MDEAACHRLVATVYDDMEVYRTLLALLPWAVHVDHKHERAQQRGERLRPRSRRRQAPRPRRRTLQRGFL